MPGLKTACLYGLKPLEFGYCIPSDHKKTVKKMIEYISGNKAKKREIRKALKKYITAYPVYLLVAKKNKIKDPFSEKVVKAYWIGNSLLNKAGGYRAHHSFHVYTIGSASGLIHFNDRLRDLCRISWGQVTNIAKELTVLCQPIKKSKKKYYLAKPIIKKIEWNKKTLPLVKKDDFISIHWNQAVEVISKKEKANLEKYTKQTLVHL